MSLKVKKVMLGQVAQHPYNVYIQFVNEEKADIVSITLLEWSTIGTT
ncbi:hypothetical protein HP570_18295 [Brevibacillus sp. RS1.1]|nr:hypothetical protein [Brevibacillus sp. RS1.1]NRR04174.1 hypothetical protein [Brevibacillus sp. RS1.1]